MTVYKRTNPSRSTGHSLGVVCLNQNMPFIPGDVQCATTFDFPVIYRVAKEGTSARILAGDSRLEGWLSDVAVALEQEGVRCISGDSGYMISYQRAVASAVDVPIALSSLVQVPLVADALDAGRTVAIVCAASPPLDVESLAELGITIGNPLVVQGMQDDAAVVEIMFSAVNISDHGTAGDTSAGPAPFDADHLAESFFNIGKQLVETYPDLGAIILECSDFPPYASAVQAAAGGIPVFDYITLINLLESGTSRTTFTAG